MTSNKNRPSDNESHPLLEESPVHQAQFSTHPPPDRGMVSGSFRLSLAENQQLQTVYALFEKRESLKTEIINPHFGGIFLREFQLFHKLPNIVKNSIQESLLEYIQEKTKVYQDTHNTKGHQLPIPSQINQEIVRHVLNNNQIERIKHEVQKLMAFHHEVDTQEAEKIIRTMIQWLENNNVQDQRETSEINMIVMKVELHRLLIRLKTSRMIDPESNINAAPDSPSSIPQPMPKKEEKDRS